ncbi:LOW QUALITY PROTEIN: hypothetical protein ACHAWF_014863 [Thalassiosira exigua]
MIAFNSAIVSLFLSPAGVDGSVAGGVGLPQMDARPEANLVERSFVGESSASAYTENLVRFILYLFDHKREYLMPFHLNQMVVFNDTDVSNFQQRPRRGGNPRRNLRGYIKRSIKAMGPARDGAPHNSPIKIDGDGALKYEVVRDYMATKFNVVEVDRDTAATYLRAIGKGGAITEEMTEGAGGRVRLEVYQSESQFSGIRSAIGYVYKSARVPMPDEMANEMSIFINGLKRTIAAAKDHLGLKISEGKDLMSFDAYEHLAKALFYSNEKRDVFNHLFLLLDWNLMKRAENCVKAKINHIRFEDDSLVFEFAKSKTQQTGDVHGPWHTYANPENPHICLVLALARYLFCYPDVLKGDVPLFEGTSQYQRYSARMLKLYEKNKNELRALGTNYKNLGSHSARKGVGSMVAAGCTVGPPIVSLCLRAGWTLGGVKDKYLFRENAGDMYVGRCASGHNVDEKSFAISPAYFDLSSMESDEKFQMRERIDHHLSNSQALPPSDEKFQMRERIDHHLSSRLPGSSSFRPNAWNLARACFASICYSYEHLNKNLHQECPLRNAAVFRDIPDNIVRCAQVRYSWNKTPDTPKLTGIPPHVVQLAKLEELERTLTAAKDEILTQMRVEMENRGFCSTEYKTKELSEAIAGVADKIVNDLMEKTDLATRVAAKSANEEMTPERHVAFVMQDEDEDAQWCAAQSEITSSSDDVNREGMREMEQKAQRAASAQLKKRRLKVGFHHGKLNPLPKQWKYSSMTSLQVVQSWFIGDLRSNIPPLCTIDSINLQL